MPLGKITTTCPNCSKSFDVDTAILGQKGRCDHCQTKFLITQTKSPAPKTSSNKPQLTAAILLACAIGGYLVHTNSQKPNYTPTTESPASSQVTQNPTTTPVTQTPNPTPQPSLPPFPIKTEFAKINIRDYQKTYPNVHQGWMPDKIDQAQEAKSWGNHYGPLGIRTRSHVPQLQSRPAFAANVPTSIQTAQGALGLTASEVIGIAPGSPAENHLQIGDLIIGIDGENLQSGNQYRPDWNFMHKDARELQLMFGEKIDQAQATGQISLTVLRYPAEKSDVFSQDLTANSTLTNTQKIPVKPGDTIQLIAEPKANYDADHIAWINPRFTGKNGELNLSDESKIKPQSATTGWGKITYGKDLQGRDLGAQAIAAHAPSTINFVVPDGYDTFQTSIKSTHPQADLTAKIILSTPQQHLPVDSKEIWSGTGGDQSVGPQDFDVEIPGEGSITLVSDKFDEVIHGDGTIWLDVVIEGDYGTKKLLGLPTSAITSGYGRPHLTTEKPYTHKDKNYAQSLNIHAQGQATWKLPKGTKRIKGTFTALSYGKVQPKIRYTNLALPLTGIHKDKIVNLRFPIGKTGSYSDTYPKNCPKTDLTVTRHTEWLAAQQLENGTWPRLAGYTTDGWDTAWCALALMSSGEKKYDEQVRKAAYHLAYNSAPSEWTAERAMRTILLSEYYLHTKDAQIIPGIQAAYFQLLDCAKTDFMAGHKVNGFGYGIAGQHYGTGHLALAMALASRTPITIDNNLAKNITQHAGEVCVNGTYAYGRGRRMARDDSRKHGGGNAMSGPGILGAQIGGGHLSAIEEHDERILASLGDGDNSHATSSLAFIFASLAIAASDEDVFLKHMQNFKYKMTNDDCWEGGFLKSAFPLDFQGGEGVTSNWIRSAGSILVLNALKHNLAITGKKELWTNDHLTAKPVSEWGGQIHSYYLRNWCLAKELLGKNAPQNLTQGITQLHSLTRDMELVPNTKKIVTNLAPNIIQTISNNKSLSPQNRAHAIELICGLDLKIYAKKSDNKQTVELEINQPLHQLNWLETDKANLFNSSPFPLKTKIQITSDNLDKPINFETNGTEGFDLDKGTRKLTTNATIKNPAQDTFDGTANIAFKIGETTVTYKRPLKFNTEFSHSNNYNLRRLKLKLKVAPRAYFQSQPLVIAGIPFDCMYPAERMLDVKMPNPDDTINIHEGDTVLVDIASENFICPWVHTMEFPSASQVETIRPTQIRPIAGKIQGEPENLYDFKQSTQCDIIAENAKAILEYDFGKEVTLNGLDANYTHTCFIRIWYKKADKWIPLVWDNYSVSTGQHPTFPETKASLWRIELQPGARKTFQTLRFYHNPNTIYTRNPLPQQTTQKFLPTLLPN